MSRGLARPVKFQRDGPRPGPALNCSEDGLPGPAHHSFKCSRPCPAQKNSPRHAPSLLTNVHQRFGTSVMRTTHEVIVVAEGVICRTWSRVAAVSPISIERRLSLYILSYPCVITLFIRVRIRPPFKVSNPTGPIITGPR